MIRVNVSGRVPARLKSGLLERAIRETFKAARRRPRGEVAVRFVSDNDIKSLNRLYRGINKPTDVLSFSAEPPVDWGDVIIAAAFAKKEASLRGVPMAEELVRLAVHGVLHLMGYDHVLKKEGTRMLALQEKVVSNVF
ncbi:rRNA maturation RNase YbeY [Patescibacteria group bacterium]|nr:rRNA maturation RNase YbeY [Patescibacteria group bacterium]